MANVNKKDLTIINELLASGKVVPLISRSFKLNEIPEAIRFLEEGHPGGKVVIKIS
jgi:D-arabinose 1-dehydrogenase-like Zn-dependent alcohol dehydrogenase